MFEARVTVHTNVIGSQFGSDAGMLKLIVSAPAFAFASKIAWRNEPPPESFVFVTRKVLASEVLLVIVRAANTSARSEKRPEVVELIKFLNLRVEVRAIEPLWLEAKRSCFIVRFGSYLLTRCTRENSANFLAIL